MSADRSRLLQRAAEQPMQIRVAFWMTAVVIITFVPLMAWLRVRSGLPGRGIWGMPLDFGIALALGGSMLWRAYKEFRELPEDVRAEVGDACERLRAKTREGRGLSLQTINPLGISSKYELYEAAGWTLLKGRGLSAWLSQAYAPGRIRIEGEHLDRLWISADAAQGGWSARAQMNESDHAIWCAWKGVDA